MEILSVAAYRIELRLTPEDASALGFACTAAANASLGSITTSPARSAAEATRLNGLYRGLGAAFEALALASVTQDYVPSKDEDKVTIEAAQDLIFAATADQPPAEPAA